MTIDQIIFLLPAVCRGLYNLTTIKVRENYDLWQNYKNYGKVALVALSSRRSARAGRQIQSE
jgi:hypothetical protein